jgi:hypothetical protein
VKQTLAVILQTTQWASKDFFVSCLIQLDTTRYYRLLFEALGHHNEKNRISSVFSNKVLLLFFLMPLITSMVDPTTA